MVRTFWVQVPNQGATRGRLLYCRCASAFGFLLYKIKFIPVSAPWPGTDKVHFHLEVTEKWCTSCFIRAVTVGPTVTQSEGVFCCCLCSLTAIDGWSDILFGQQWTKSLQPIDREGGGVAHINRSMLERPHRGEEQHNTTGHQPITSDHEHDQGCNDEDVISCL